MTIIANILPSTINGIKRKAKSIGRKNEIPHHNALDIAAKQSGFECFYHARKVLQRGQKALPLHSIFLSAYWRDTSTKPVSAGLEILEVKLRKPLLSILSKHQCSYAQNLQGLFVEYSDHLEMRGNVENYARAKEVLIRAALTLQFIEATGLQPVTTKVQRATMKSVDELPFTDHVSRWISTATGDWLVLDEPYDHVTKQPKFGVRDAWVQASGLHWARPNWNGLYYPGQSVPHMLASNPDFLRQTLIAVEGLSDNTLKKFDEWVVLSQQYNSQFISPIRHLEGKQRRPRLGTTYSYSKNAVEFQWCPGYSTRWRPAQIMSIENHKELGWTLKRLCRSDLPYKANLKLQEIQSELEDWMFAEYQRQSPNEVDVDVYYGGRDIPAYVGVAKIIEAIDHVRSTLESAYLDSKPLRDLLKQLSFMRTYIVNS